jgi:muramoyltetrapeptide carboxypeptidase LdcA involved in peptidoglycan recycling
MVSFYGPNYINDLSEMAVRMLSYTKQAFGGYLGGEFPFYSSPVWYEERTDFSPRQLGIDRISHPEKHGFEVLQGRGCFRGKLLGGCLESLYDILIQNRYPDEKQICEQYRLFPTKEEWRGKVLFLETCEETPAPELLAKELTALKDRGVFEVISGLLIGKPQNEVWYEEYKEVYRQVIGNPQLPILYNLNFGHAYPRMVLPYGIEMEVDMDTKQLRLCETPFEF